MRRLPERFQELLTKDMARRDTNAAHAEAASVPRVLTAGYTGRSPHRLYALAVALDAVVVDIRLQPRSRAPQWQKRSLAGLLGSRYTLCAELGNVNYRNGGPIEICDMGFGLVYLLEKLSQHRRLILLCVCREPDCCHRRVVADELTRVHGIETAELDWGMGG